jgi:hypothetical protein
MYASRNHQSGQELLFDKRHQQSFTMGHHSLPHVQTNSSVSSMSSSKTSSTTCSPSLAMLLVLCSSSSSLGSGRPSSSLSSLTSSHSLSTQAYHSWYNLLRCSTIAIFAPSSNSLSSSSNSLLYSRRFLRIVRCSSFDSSIGGLGLQSSCLNFSVGTSASSTPENVYK